jgi:probable phosphoglycerate mutase
VSTVFHLIRHAAHDQLGKVLTGRMDGAPLSEGGRRQAEALAKCLTVEKLDAIRTSPRTRTRETAEAIAAGRDLAIKISEELDEIDFGHWAGRPFESLESDPDWENWNEQRGSARTPAGESMAEVADRLMGLMDRLCQKYPHGAVALVSHCDVIKAGVCRILGLPFEHVHRFEIDPGSVTTVVLGDWGGKLLWLNRTADASGGAA